MAFIANEIESKIAEENVENFDVWALKSNRQTSEFYIASLNQ